MSLKSDYSLIPSAPGLHMFRSSIDNAKQIRFCTSVHRNCVMAANIMQTCINSGVEYRTFQIHSRAATETLIKQTSCVHQVRVSCTFGPLLDCWEPFMLTTQAACDKCTPTTTAAPQLTCWSCVAS